MWRLSGGIWGDIFTYLAHHGAIWESVFYTKFDRKVASKPAKGKNPNFSFSRPPPVTGSRKQKAES